MKRNLTIATILTAAGLSAAGMAYAAGTGAQAGAQGSGMTEAQMFQNAKISLQQATDIAKKELPGTLQSIGFNDENGKGMYEATVIDASGAASIVKIDADTGAVLGKGLASSMQDEQGESGENGENGGNGENGESENG